LKQVPMPKVGAQLLYWRCTDGREVYFHVRKGWMSETQDADDPTRFAPSCSGCTRARSADKVDAQMRREVLKAVAKVRNQVA
jgi:hypothetical protein